jgi:hypothetical protein
MILLFVSQLASHGGQPCSQVKAWALAHKGKATSDVDFNPKDPSWHTTIHASTAASASTHRRQGRSMGQSMIRAPRILKETLPWGWEEARSVGGTGLATAYSTRPLLPLSLRSEQSTHAKGHIYAHGQTLHNIGCRHCRLFLFYSSFIVFYIPLICIVTLGWNVVGWAGRREEATSGVGGKDWGRPAQVGADVSMDAKS